MITKNVELTDCYSKLKGGKLRMLLSENPWDSGHSDWIRPAVIVVPGGGYHFVSRREAEPVASWFYAAGYQVFTLEYLCRPQGVGYPEQLLELACAMDYVKRNAEEFFINKDEIFVVGFSAGGHLVADLCNEYAEVPSLYGGMLDCKPTGAALCYPVTESNSGTFENLTFNLSDERREELKTKLDLSARVTSATPPTFIWTTAEDDIVPVHNSLNYALALDRAKVPFELHVYPHGRHGLSTGMREINEREEPCLNDVFHWLGDCARFFRFFCKERG